MRALTILSEPSVAEPGMARGGDKAVLASMKRGLRKNRVRFDHNPAGRRGPAEAVVVQSDPAALDLALTWKAEGRIRRLIAGPNLVVLPSDHPALADPGVDVCIVPSEWVKTAYEEDTPALAGRIGVWAAGVDTEYWQRDSDRRPEHVLIYRKSPEERLFHEVRELVEASAVSYSVIAYGNYDAAFYRALLNESSVAIFLSRSESQGIALAEAWAMDVPTLAWDPGEFVYRGRPYSEVSAAPYLTPATGSRWRTAAELAQLLASGAWRGCAPREWVLDNLTDRIAGQKLLELARPAPRGRFHRAYNWG